MSLQSVNCTVHFPHTVSGVRLGRPYFFASASCAARIHAAARLSSSSPLAAAAFPNLLCI